MNDVSGSPEPTTDKNAPRATSDDPAVVDFAPGSASPAATLSAADASASRRRWVVAALVTAVVLVVAVLAASLLAGRSRPEGLRYIPAGALAVAEIRPELPGDQRARLGKLLAHFPGFKDQSTLDKKLDESLQLLTTRLTSGQTDYRKDVKPYLAGPAIVALLGLPTDGTSMPRVVAVLTTDGSAGCLMPADVTTTTETYEGHELTIGTRDGGPLIACTIDARYAILGDPASVRAALDAHRDGKSVADDQTYQAAQRALDEDHLAGLVVNVKSIVTGLGALDPAMSGALSALPVDRLPDWAAVSLRAEDDALVLDAAMPTLSAGVTPPSSGPSRVSDLAGRLPGTTVAAVETRDVGKAIKAAFDAARADPSQAPTLKQIEQAAALLGGIDGLTRWMGDLAIVATLDGTNVTGGVVIEATDIAAAQGTLAAIHNLVVLAGTGSDITLNEVDHNGTTISVVDLGNLSSLFSELGGTPAATPGTTTPGAATPSFTIAWAMRDDLVIVGLGEAFVASVLDAHDGATLADSDRYEHVIGRAGAVNDGQGFVDVAAIVSFIGEGLAEDAADAWRENTYPWVAPLEGAAFTATRSDNLWRSRAILTVR